jgi:hypothetical protein
MCDVEGDPCIRVTSVSESVHSVHAGTKNASRSNYFLHETRRHAAPSLTSIKEPEPFGDDTTAKSIQLSGSVSEQCGDWLIYIL